MDAQEAQQQLASALTRLSAEFSRLPGSAILLRYIRSSYQDDPIRSAVELFLVLFALRYLMAPKYSTKPNHVALSEEVSGEPLLFFLGGGGGERFFWADEVSVWFRLTRFSCW
jgi:hypothetical protein